MNNSKNKLNSEIILIFNPNLNAHLRLDSPPKKIERKRDLRLRIFSSQTWYKLMKSNPPVLDSLLEAAFSHFFVCVSYVIAGLNSIAVQLQINHQLHRTEIVDKSHRSRD